MNQLKAPIIRLFQSEIIKVRYNFAVWLIILAALPRPLLVKFDFIDHGKDISQFHTNLWNSLWEETIRGFVVLSGLICRLANLYVHEIEHKYNAWKYLLTLPVKKTTLFTSKLVMNLLLLLVLYLLLFTFFFLSGLFLAWLYPR